jgi:hypothetical protein
MQVKCLQFLQEITYNVYQFGDFDICSSGSWIPVFGGPIIFFSYSKIVSTLKLQSKYISLVTQVWMNV